MCLGMKLAYQEMRLILARLLWSFDLALKDSKDVWDWGEQSTYIFWVSGFTSWLNNWLTIRQDKKALEVTLTHVNK